jgi:hypothetical protein
MKSTKKKIASRTCLKPTYPKGLVSL